MKKGFLALLVVGAMNASAAVDFGTYCTKYINGELGADKPSILEDFEAINLNEKGEPLQYQQTDANKRVHSMLFKFSPKQENEGVVADVDTKMIVDEEEDDEEEVKVEAKKYSSKAITGHSQKLKKKFEVQTFTIKRPSKNGKRMVVDYKIEIIRDFEGKILSIKKDHAFMDFKPSEKLKFVYKNNTCIPNESFKKLQREFSTTMCRDLHEFYQKNPKAQECIENGYDMQVRNIVEKYQRGGEDLLRFFRSKKYGGTMLSGKALGDCYNAGVGKLIEDDKVWKTEVAPEVIKEDDGKANEN